MAGADGFLNSAKGGGVLRLTFSRLLFSLVAVALVVEAAKAAEKEFITSEHDVKNLNSNSFKQKIYNKRAEEVSLVLLCPADSTAACLEVLHGEYNDVAAELKGAVTLAAVECAKNKVLCKEINPNGTQVTESPVIIVFPPLPVPAYEYEGPFTANGFKKEINRHLSTSGITSVTKQNSAEFLQKYPTLPKALFFVDKPRIPFFMKTLNKVFSEKIKFAYVSSDETDLVKRWNVKKFPEVVVMRTSGDVERYEGAITHQELFDWLNIFSETFASGTGKSAGKVIEDKPWKYERIPELTKASSREICFTKEQKGLCVIYIKEGDTLTEDETEMLENNKQKFTSHVDGRGINFRWMWMNVLLEKDAAQMFETDVYPTVTIVNPHRRVRFVGLEKGVVFSNNALENLIEKVSAGVKFNPIETPTFSVRQVVKGSNDEL